MMPARPIGMPGVVWLLLVVVLRGGSRKSRCRGCVRQTWLPVPTDPPSLATVPPSLATVLEAEDDDLAETRRCCVCAPGVCAHRARPPGAV